MIVVNTTANSSGNSILGINNKSLVQTIDPIETNDCVKGCFNNGSRSGWYYCTNGINSGNCCPPGSTNPLCLDSPNDGVYCSYNASLIDSNLKYTFCPRRLSACGKTLGS